MLAKEITFDNLPEVVATILDEVRELRKERSNNPEQTPETQNPFDEYIPRAEITPKHISSATLWKWERKGKLKAYSIGSKKYYKRTDVEQLFTAKK